MRQYCGADERELNGLFMFLPVLEYCAWEAMLKSALMLKILGVRLFL
jgi:hypothetical protein